MKVRHTQTGKAAPSRTDLRFHGPGDWLVAACLQKLMKEVYGADTFEGCDSLGI